MKKHLAVFFIILFLWASSCNEETPVSKTSQEKIVVTDLDHEPIAKDLLSKLQGRASNGRINSLEIKDAFFKYENPDSGVLNYTFPLPYESPDYFENMILSKYDDGFYGFIYRYIPDESYIKGESFRGTLQQFDLEENLIGEFSIPFKQDSIYKSGRTQMVNQCVKSIEQNCVTTYKVETVTDYPCHCQYDRKTQLSSVCTFSFNMGMCDDMIAVPPAGGGGTYVATGSGPSPKAGGGNTTGTTKPKTKPVVIVVPENDLYVGDECVACIENLLKNPCLKMVAKKVLNPALASSYNKLIQDMFNKNDKVNLIIREGDAEDMKIPEKKMANGWTEPVESHNGIVDVIIELNTENLNENDSQEYIASVIYHEAFHAIVHYFDKDKWFSENTPTDDHVAIFYTYLDLIASGLQKAYPNLTLREAQGLILKGMMAYEKQWGDLFNKILDKKNFTKEQIDTIVRRYENKTSGTSCD
ncbi:type III secretion system effector protein [Ohtaekwangia koreensis]|uniref:Uncharacterized protein n=1 Tax=Ohtaekwangia koreensis TaxID=688867 RepID=A0A1T5LT27_9BACT|nr:hypothetical protein [Ohtaekwangia koreensis]SKC78975.1 hypothetical protein SAMN05660236_3848 [Ohtaekwangia koreensis]